MFKKPKTPPRRERQGAKEQGRAPYTRYYQREPQKAVEPEIKNSASELFSKLFNVAIMLILLFSAGYSLIDRKISISAVSSGSLHSKVDYQTSLDKVTSGPLYRIKPLFSEGQATKKLQQAYPEITDVSYDIPWLGSRITAKISTARPVLQLTSQAAGLVIDEQGRAIIKSNDVNNSTVENLPLVQDQTGYQAGVGQLVLTKRQVQFIETVYSQLKAKNLLPSAIILPPKAQELDVRLVGLSYYVKFYMGGDPLFQSGAFFATKQKLAAAGQTPAEYVDVRVEDRVFVK